MRILLLSCFALGLPQLMCAQMGSVTYKRAKLYFKDHRVLKVDNLRIDHSTYLFDEDESSKGKQNSVLAEEISMIKIPKGNYAVEGALIGTATLGLSALFIDLDTDPLGRPNEKEAGFYLGMAGAGAIAGALIGLAVPKWKRLSLESRSLGLHIPLEVDFSSNTAFLNVKIIMTL
ncbi:MAG: hypothetical protein AAF361_10630 [Bacteroidota bacterium]